jgi:hypothetical protein
MYRDDSARIEFDDEPNFVSSELPEPIPVTYTEYVVREWTRHFVPWEVARHGGRSWWAFGESYFIASEGHQPHEAVELIRNEDPDLHELTVLEQRDKWPVEEPSDCYCDRVTLDGDEYMILIDLQQDDAQREMVAHWTLADFDGLIEQALQSAVKLADRTSDPHVDAMNSRNPLLGWLVGRPSGQFFLFRGLLFTAPNDWPAREVEKWAEVRKGVADAAGGDDFSPPRAADWAAAVDESFRALADHAEMVRQVQVQLASMELLQPSPKAIEEVRGPTREPIPREAQREVWRRDTGRCVECGRQERLEYDHIVPLSRGGSNTVRNLQLLCEPCNRSKGARM